MPNYFFTIGNGMTASAQNDTTVNLNGMKIGTLLAIFALLVMGGWRVISRKQVAHSPVAPHAPSVGSQAIPPVAMSEPQAPQTERRSTLCDFPATFSDGIARLKELIREGEFYQGQAVLHRFAGRREDFLNAIHRSQSTLLKGEVVAEDILGVCSASTELYDAIESAFATEGKDAWASHYARKASYQRRLVEHNELPMDKGLARLALELNTKAPPAFDWALADLENLDPAPAGVVETLLDACDDSKVGPRARNTLRALGYRAHEALISELERLPKHRRTKALIIVEAIGEIGPSASIAIPFLARIGAGENEVGEVAVTAMGRLGAPALPALRELLGRVSFEKKTQILRAFGDVGPDAVPDLIGFLGQAEFKLRGNALVSLERIGKPASAALPAIAKLCESENPGEGLYALRVVLTVAPEDPSVLPVLLGALKREATRNYAAQHLAWLGPSARQGLPQLRDVRKRTGSEILDVTIASVEGDASSLVRMLAHKDEFTRKLAALSLGRLKTAAMEPVAQAFRTTSDREARLLLLGVVSEIGQEASAALPNVLSLLGESEEKLRRRAAATVLLVVGPKEPVPQEAESEFIRWSQDRNPELRCLGLRAVARISAPSREAMDSIVAGLSDVESSVRATAAEVFGYLPLSPHALDQLCACLWDADRSVRAAARVALSSTGQ